MSFWQAIGALMLASPFVAISVISAKLNGFRATTALFAIAFAVVVVTFVGVALLKGDLP